MERVELFSFFFFCFFPLVHEFGFKFGEGKRNPHQKTSPQQSRLDWLICFWKRPNIPHLYCLRVTVCVNKFWRGPGEGRCSEALVSEFCGGGLQEEKIEAEVISYIQICKNLALADACVDKWWSVYLSGQGWVCLLNYEFIHQRQSLLKFLL